MSRKRKHQSPSYSKKIAGKRIGPREFSYVREALREFGAHVKESMVERLERRFAKKFHSRYAISHVNGTATLHSCLAAAGVGIGDEVIVPPLTMSSPAFAVLQQNAVPVFADVDPDTFTVSPHSVEKLISRRTKAIIPVALYGLPADMGHIMRIAKPRGITVIEDNAQCFLGYAGGKLAGTIGNMASYSFQNSKHMTSGEGGMVITNEKKTADAIRKFNSLGYAGVGARKFKITKKDIQDPRYSRHITLGWNYRMPELCAGMALAQLERLDELVRRRMKIGHAYGEVIKKCSWLRPQYVPEGYRHSYWTYAVVLEHPKVTWHEFRDTFVEYGGDGFYAAWKLTYLEPLFQTRNFGGRERFFRKPLYRGTPQRYRIGLCPNAEYLQPRLIQFKTNYVDDRRLSQQLEALTKAIRYFEKRFPLS